MEVRWRGTGGRVGEETETSWLHHLSDYLGATEEPEPMSCEANPDYEGTPSLASMTDLALRHLSQDKDRGLFLMIESASIDKNPTSAIPAVQLARLSNLRSLSRWRSHSQHSIRIPRSSSQRTMLRPRRSCPSPVFIRIIRSLSIRRGLRHALRPPRAA